MDELLSSKSSPSEQDSNSSFQNLRLSGSQFQELEPYNPYTIQEVPYLSSMPEKSLTESVRDTYNMYCSNIRTMKTNLAYNLRHSTFDIFTKRQKVILNKNEPVVLLGRVYENKSKDKEKFYLNFNNVIWLTYRSKIYGVETDAGWGCMIRVCQMVLAQTFKRVAPQVSLNQIINYFRDTPEAYFSLTRICQKGDIKKRWTSSIEIFCLLKNLIAKFHDIQLSIGLHSSCIEISNLKELHYIEYPSLIFVSNRLGKDRLQKEFKDHLLEIMGLPSFVGLVGGNGGEALYLIGHYSQKIIFMDPHYVQEYQQNEQGKNTSTYFQSQPYSIDIECLVPSIAVNFLVKSREQYECLLKQLYQIQYKHYPWVCFQVLSQELKNTVKPEVHKDDKFELIE